MTTATGAKHVGRIAEWVEGTIERVGDYGVLLAGEPAWFNFSRFHELPAVERGQGVRLGLNPKGYIVLIEFLTPDEQAELGGQVRTTGTFPVAPPQATGTLPSPELVLARAECLRAAAAILGCGPATMCDPQDILAIAEQLEEWVLRPASAGRVS